MYPPRQKKVDGCAYLDSIQAEVSDSVLESNFWGNTHPFVILFLRESRCPKNSSTSGPALTAIAQHANVHVLSATRVELVQRLDEGVAVCVVRCQGDSVSNMHDMSLLKV